MWEDSSYCWVVPCKNYFFHVRQNIFYRHRIPVAETDAFAALPPLKGRFRVRCGSRQGVPYKRSCCEWKESYRYRSFLTRYFGGRKVKAQPVLESPSHT